MFETDHLGIVTDIAKGSRQSLEEVIEISFSSRSRRDFALANINRMRKTSTVNHSAAVLMASVLIDNDCIIFVILSSLTIIDTPLLMHTTRNYVYGIP